MSRPELADLGHVGAHDRVAALGHHRDCPRAAISAGSPCPASRCPARLGDLLHLVEVRCAPRSRSGGGSPAARRESSNWPPGSRLMLQPCLVSAIGLPSSSTGSQPNRAVRPVEQRADAARALIGQRAQVVAGEAELLVLGADPPRRARLAALLQILDQLALVGDRFAFAARRCRHQVPFFSPSLRPAAPAGPQRRRHSAARRAPQQMLHTEPAPPTVGECVANAFMVRCQGPVLARWSSSIRQE